MSELPSGPGSDSRPSPEEERRVRGEQMLEAFNVYRTAALLDVLDRPRTIVFVDGVVLSGEATVISADPGGVVLKVNAAQLQALARTRRALVESPLHGASYRGTVAEVDSRRGYVSLGALEPFDDYHERRGHGRTVPGSPMLVRACGLGREASGRVVDLSPCALAADFEPEGFSRVARAPLLRVEVWGEHGPATSLDDFSSTAQVHRTEQRPECRPAACRAVLALDAYPALERALRRYVARRQLEIMTRLREAAGRHTP